MLKFTYLNKEKKFMAEKILQRPLSLTNKKPQLPKESVAVALGLGA